MKCRLLFYFKSLWYFNSINTIAQICSSQRNICNKVIKLSRLAITDERVPVNNKWDAFNIFVAVAAI